MTNLEKFREQIELFALSGTSWSKLAGSDKFASCRNITCDNCQFNDCDINQTCSDLKLAWLQQEYEKPEVDWTKVEMDTPILVKDYEDNNWIERYFATYFNGVVYAWFNGKTSEKTNELIDWKYAKLAEK